MHHHTSPSRQSQVIASSVSSSAVTGRTNSDASSSGVRRIPEGASTDVGPRQGSQPRDGVHVSPSLRGAERTELVGASNHLFDGVHQRVGQALAPPVLTDRDAFDVAAPKCGVAVQQPARHDGGVRDQRAVMKHDRVHTAEGVLPVGIGEVDLAATEGVDDHATGFVAGLVVEVGGVDQAGSHYLGGHTMCLLAQEPLWKG